MSMTVPAAAPLLRAERLLSEVLDACHYRSTVVRLAGVRPLAPGCALSLQFGDQVSSTASGELCLTIRCGLQINGAADYAVGATCRQIRLTVQRHAGAERLNLALEADLILASNFTMTDALARGREIYRSLRLLIADARDTVNELAFDKSARDDTPGPAVRIEARLLGDLISGRSGVVAAKGSGISSRQRRITSAACDWLADQALPDLARAVRDAIRQANPPLRRPVQAGAGEGPSSLQDGKSGDNPDGQSGAGDDPSIVPSLEPI